ncbi:hypothetical protein MUK42_14064 [Musa troglodytarum]|uniref:Uncharacterized protein n=1 Tax=Musa troglodytarum TaxID=320322 RepID=A0A9E7GL61_9LILI|nr:hypothetical protein MUK42_14064 [Musa troglodytarum]
MMTSARAASRIGGHRNLLFVPSPTTTTTTHHDQCHGEEQCQENTYKLFSSWKKKTTTMRKQTEEMSPSSNCKRLSTLLFRIHSAPYYCSDTAQKNQTELMMGSHSLLVTSVAWQGKGLATVS